MEDWRSYSYSYGDGRMQQIEVCGARGGVPSNGLHDLRCYSASYTSTQQQPPRETQFKKGKSVSGSSSSSKVGGWSFSDPEFQRKKRVASYKAYSVESKMKGSLRKSFRWLKDKYTQAVYGWW